VGKRSISCCRRKRDAVAAKHFLQLALWRTGQAGPRVINVDGHPSYPAAIKELKDSGIVSRRCRVRPCQYLNNVLEQDHRFVKKRIAVSLWFRSVDGALRTIQGYEAMNMIRKGQVSWLAKGDIVGQVRYVERVFGLALG
jgi:transposase-like protein